ncbi:hypothetical protein ES332_D13G096200v1 [Gossypium tomentosum]|uniref:Uncharacterized protein n=1 Tax=Gossypium tomentosum TaxID=34277 RepID=A0A5D2HUY8_GOSTO|nr:hypothetical protein ES332_D13G096200v1 [Gossypium tomentosum]
MLLQSLLRHHAPLVHLYPSTLLHLPLFLLLSCSCWNCTKKRKKKTTLLPGTRQDPPILQPSITKLYKEKEKNSTKNKKRKIIVNLWHDKREGEMYETFG